MCMHSDSTSSPSLAAVTFTAAAGPQIKSALGRDSVEPVAK